jgi:hypothetical protein
MWDLVLIILEIPIQIINISKSKIVSKVNFSKSSKIFKYSVVSVLILFNSLFLGI